ncbi:dihydrolipoamide acetyltransferase, partial [Helicobacter pylori]
MVNPLQSLRLPLGHPLVEKLCKLSLNNNAAFNEKSEVNFKEEVSKEDRTKFEQA